MPDRTLMRFTVVCFTGDGSLQMNIQELATAAETGVNVKIVLANNNGLGLVQQQQDLLREEVEHTNRQLERMSRFDPLTELANRRYLDEFLKLAWARAQHDGHDVALLMIDIDHFKAYNDCYGHAQGDG